VILCDECAETLRVLQLIFFLERKIDDLKSPRLITVIEVYQKSGLVMAIRASTAAYCHDHDLAFEPRVRA
jgi:hypothetical protein